MEKNKSESSVIVHLSSERTFRGGERQCVLLHNGIRTRGFKSYIFCRSGGEFASQPIENLIPFSFKGLHDISALRSLYKMCKGVSATIVHCHDSKAFTLGALIKTLLPQIRLIYSRKVLFPIRPGAFNRWKFSRCSHLIAISNAVYAQCKTAAPHTRMSIIPDASEPEIIRLSHDEARLQLGLTQNDICVGSVAYFTKEKNLESLIKCADHFGKINSSIKFVLIGPVDKEMEYEVKRNPSIIMIGYVQNAVSLYNGFDVYLSTSVSEGLGSALLDAIIHDIPCAALDAGGTRDLFGQYGTPASDHADLIRKLSTIFADYSCAQQQARQRGAWARTIFTPDALVTKHTDIYKTV